MTKPFFSCLESELDFYREGYYRLLRQNRVVTHSDKQRTLESYGVKV